MNRSPTVSPAIATVALLVLALVAGSASAADPQPIVPPAAAELPPDWLPIVSISRDSPKWFPFKKNPPPGPVLYLPEGVKRLRGVFVCYIFHGQDPRELADLWEFALVAVPPACEFDIGFFDKRNERGKQGRPPGSTANILTYLDIAAKQFGHPELATAPIVGWVGQNGGVIATDLMQRAPQRVIAWVDAWDWAKHPAVSATVPVANGWELKEQARAPSIARIPGLAGQPTPPTYLGCATTTYGFGHGIFSKYVFFSFWLDRAIQLRLPTAMPPPGKPVPLTALALADGWAGDYAPIGAWNPIAPVKAATGFASPVWFPDEYTAWGWRAFHSNCEDLELTGPSSAFAKQTKFSAKLGNGYGGNLSVGSKATFSAAVTGPYAKIEFYDGNIKLGEATGPSWKVSGVLLANRGVRAFHIVGTRADGSKSASRPAFPIVR